MRPVLKIRWRSVKILLRYLSFCWNLTKIAHFEPIQATLVAKLAIMCHFEPLWCEMIWKKLKKLKTFADVPLPMEWKFLRFLQKWDAVVAKDGKSCESGEMVIQESIWASFWGKRWKNLQNDQNWPILSQFKPLFWQNLPLWIILSLSGVKQFEKVEKLKKFADVPPKNKDFWDFSKNEMLWWQKTGKVVNQVKLAIPSQSEPDFRAKDEKTCKMTKIGHLEPI